MPLDNPIWSSLTTRHARFAIGDRDAVRFPAEVTLLAGVRAPDAACFDALTRTLAPGASAGVFLDETPMLPPSVQCMDTASIVQMVQTESPSTPASSSIVEWFELDETDASEMVALAERTRPGPFGPRTREMGTFLGVRVNGSLVAMAGQRLWLEGHREISGVCTDAEHLGRGYAAMLMHEIARRIRAAGEVPFLHVRAENARAIAVYERLGFRERRRFQYVQIAASQDARVTT